MGQPGAQQRVLIAGTDMYEKITVFLTTWTAPL